MNKKAIIIAVVVIILVIATYFVFTGNNQKEIKQVTNDQQQNDTQLVREPTVNDTPDANTNTGKTYEVIYTDSGYAPKEITINKGETVVFKNQSSLGLWTASALHPTHVIYSGTSLEEHCPDPENVAFDECKSTQPGQSWSFTFEKSGIWRYHDHLTPSKFGTVIVE